MASRKKTPKAKKSEAVASTGFEELPKAPKVESKEHFDELMGKSYSRPSTAKSRPVDEEGLPYLKMDEISNFYGVHPDTVKRWTHTREIPHFVEQKGLGRSTEGQDPSEVDVLQRGTRTWFKHAQVVDFLKNIGHLGAVPAEQHLERARLDVKRRKKAGEAVPTLHDNPEHPTLSHRLISFGSGRRVTENLTPPAEDKGEAFQAGMYTSNIMDALRSGSGTLVGPKKKSRKKQ